MAVRATAGRKPAAGEYRVWEVQGETSARKTKQTCSSAPPRAVPRGFGHFPKVSTPSSVGSAARLGPPTGLPSALVLAARKLPDTGAEKRRQSFF